MRKTSSAGLIILLFIAFISLGLPDGLLGVAWPGIRDTFGLPLDAMGLLLVFGTAGYMLSSFFSGVLLRRLGVGGLLALSCLATSTTLLVYAVTPIWSLFVLIASLGGLGAGAIDAGINTYVAHHYSERTMQWLHASFGVGITSGPMIMTLGLTLTSRWQSGYFWAAAAQVILAALFFATRKSWKADRRSGGEYHESGDATMLQTLGNLPSLLSALLFFFYTGVELGLGLWAYTLLTESRAVSKQIAGIVTGSYWATFTFGRILAGLYARRFRIRPLIYLSLFGALSGILLILVDLGSTVTVIGITLAGFSVAPVFPGLTSETGSRVGRRHQANTIGMQISAAGLGAAVLPSVAGVLARRFGLEVIPAYLALAIVILIGGYTVSVALSRRVRPAITD